MNFEIQHDFQRLLLFTIQINELNKIFNREDFFPHQLEEILLMTASFLNASSGRLELNFQNQSFRYQIGAVENTQKWVFDSFEAELDFLKNLNSNEVLFEPIQIDNKLSGYFLFTHKESKSGNKTFSEPDFSILKNVAHSFSLALERVASHKKKEILHSLNEAILNSSSASIIATDSALNIQTTNKKAQLWLGLITDFQGEHLLNFFPQSSKVRLFIENARNSGERMMTENLSYSASSGQLFNCYFSPIVLGHNETDNGYLFVFEDVTEVSKLKKTFNTYIGNDVLEAILTGKNSLRPGGIKTEAAVLFSDIRGFTSFAEKNEAETVVETLNQYFNTTIHCVETEFGRVDKLVGDEIMAVFYEQDGLEHPAVRAVNAAITMQNQLSEFNSVRLQLGELPIFTGIGINYGEVFSGNIGSFKRLDYTVIGDVVNVAARLCSSAIKDQIIISESVKDELTDYTFTIVPIPTIQLKGKSNKVTAYSVY